jgi:hypothetical protein
MTMNILYFILGCVLLIAGRKLYWLLSAVAGMIAGIFLGNLLFNAQNQAWQIVIAIIGAVVGAALAVGLQKLAIAAAGFLAGGYGALFLWQTIGLPTGNIGWVPFIIGGVLGTILVVIAFEYALIAISAWAGATLVGQQLNLGGWIGVVAFAGLILAGVVIQSVTLVSDRHRAPKQSKG